jgi:hypothetical protein
LDYGLSCLAIKPSAMGSGQAILKPWDSRTFDRCHNQNASALTQHSIIDTDALEIPS